MFTKYSVSIYYTKKDDSKFMVAELYDELLNIGLFKRVIYSKKELIDFFKEIKTYFNKKELKEIQKEFDLLKIRKNPKKIQTNQDHDHNISRTHETKNLKKYE